MKNQNHWKNAYLFIIPFLFHTGILETVIIEQLSLRNSNYPKALATVLGVVGRKDWFSQSNSSFLGKENYFRRKKKF